MKDNKIKILEGSDVGYGLLIENDAGYITSDMSVINENFIPKENEPILIPTILQKYGVKNRNGRIYPKEVLYPQVELYKKIVEENSGGGSADHPDSSIVSLQDISHMITKMWWGVGGNENTLYGELKLIVSPGFIKYGVVSTIGDKILLYIQNGYKIGISSRGVGTLKQINGENIVQNDFELIAFDLVGTPSTPGAYLFPGKTIQDLGFNENTKKYQNENLFINAIDKFLL